MNYPIEIKKEQGHLQIKWNNQEIQKISYLTLRKSCPCASCKEARGEINHEQPLNNKKSSLRVIKNTIIEETKLEKICLIGNYAIGLTWLDGHSTGIYTYEYLKLL